MAEPSTGSYYLAAGLLVVILLMFLWMRVSRVLFSFTAFMGITLLAVFRRLVMDDWNLLAWSVAAALVGSIMLYRMIPFVYRWLDERVTHSQSAPRHRLPSTTVVNDNPHMLNVAQRAGRTQLSLIISVALALFVWSLYTNVLLLVDPVTSLIVRIVAIVIQGWLIPVYLVIVLTSIWSLLGRVVLEDHTEFLLVTHRLWKFQRETRYDYDLIKAYQSTRFRSCEIQGLPWSINAVFGLGNHGLLIRYQGRIAALPLGTDDDEASEIVERLYGWSHPLTH